MKITSQKIASLRIERNVRAFADRNRLSMLIAGEHAGVSFEFGAVGHRHAKNQYEVWFYMEDVFISSIEITLSHHKNVETLIDHIQSEIETGYIQRKAVEVIEDHKRLELQFKELEKAHAKA